MTATLTESQLDLPLLARGKVRDVYDLGDKLLIVATDRLSAFDVILPAGIPDKGARPHPALGLLVRADRRHRAEPLHPPRRLHSRATACPSICHAR